LFVSIVFNALSLWPFGAFRTNVFLLAYVIFIPMFSLDVLLGAPVALARLAGAAGSALLLVTNLSAGFEPHARKHFFSTQTEMASLVARMAAVRAQEPPELTSHPTPVLLDSYSCSPFIFEADYNDTAKRELSSFLKNIDVRCPPTMAAMQKFLHGAAGKPFFVVISDERTMPAFARMLRTQSRVRAYEQIRDTHALYFVTAR
jgi:hypothetical protein